MKKIFVGLIILSSLLIVACAPSQSMQDSDNAVAGDDVLSGDTANLDSDLQDLNDLESLDEGLDDINFNDLENLDLN